MGYDTQQSRYAVLAVLEMARVYQKNQPISIHKIADKYSFSSAFLAQVFRRLREANLVEPVRGSMGGYKLVSSPHEITVGYVIGLFDQVEKSTIVMDKASSSDSGQAQKRVEEILKKSEAFKQQYLNSISYSDLIKEIDEPHNLDFSI